MKLLLDENISFRVIKSISSIFPESIHVTKSETRVRIDGDIFDYARLNQFTIVTYDEDFYDLQLLRGYPPKIIWQRFGNASNSKLTSKLRENEFVIKSFFNNPLIGMLEIY